MLWTISILILLFFWLLGLTSGYTANYLTHLPLFFAIIAVLLKIEDIRSGYRSDHRKRYLNGQWLSRSGKILSKLTILSGEKISQLTISPQTGKKE